MLESFVDITVLTFTFKRSSFLISQSLRGIWFVSVFVLLSFRCSAAGRVFVCCCEILELDSRCSSLSGTKNTSGSGLIVRIAAVSIGLLAATRT